jgi:PAS domain S-box-containing protein
MTEKSSFLDPSNRPVATLDDASFRLLVASVRDYAIFMLDVAGRVITWNKGAELIKGYGVNDIIGCHFSKFYTPDAIARGFPDYELEVAAETGRFEDEGWRVKKDGSRFWANVVITALRSEQGALVGYAKITRDLTERRRQEEALRENEERFRSLIEGVKDYAIFMLDPKGVVVTWNAGAERIKGYEAHEIIGSHFSCFYEAEAVRTGYPDYELRRATLDGRWEDEGWRLRKDGSRFWAHVLITAVRDPSGKLVGFSKITRDLTERQRYEDDLRREQERFRLLVDGVTEYAIIMLDKDGFVVSWNAGAQRIKGYAAEEVLGKHISNFYTSEDVADNKPWRDLSYAREHGRVRDEGWRVRKDRSLFWAGTVVTALRQSDGTPYGFAKVTQDLTDRRHAESLADTAEHMHEFIAMLAHELRNPLAPIRNAVALMGLKGLKDPVLESMRQTIDRQSAHLTRLLDELLDVNRVARGNFCIDQKPIDLHDAITRAIEASRPLIDSRGHRLHIDLPDEPIPVCGDTVRLTQAFVNVLNNAARYTREGGDIHLSVLMRRGNVELHIRDTGIGIDKGELEKVFELFVQLAPQSPSSLTGMGVGLALVRRIVELHRGSVQARSAGAGLGSEFIIRLPVAVQPETAVHAATQPDEPTRTERLRVLVVDDNRDAADSLRMLLEHMNQEVLAVYDGASALAAVQTYCPDIVMLDIGMPGMSGYEVARKLTAEDAENCRPTLVALTGWGQESDKKLARACGFHHHLVKPASDAAIRSILIEVAKQPNRARGN